MIPSGPRPSPTPRVRVPIDMPVTLRQWVVEYAARTNQSMAAVLRQAVERFREEMRYDKS